MEQLRWIKDLRDKCSDSEYVATAMTRRAEHLKPEGVAPLKVRRVLADVAQRFSDVEVLCKALINSCATTRVDGLANRIGHT